LDLGRADPAELIGRTDIELFGREFGEMTMLDDARIMETDEPIIGLTESRQLESGQVNWTLTTKTPLHDLSGTVVGLLGITREINELKRAEMTLEHLATHDTLTGLPNRYLMFDRLNQLLVRAARYGLSFAILFIDLDGFKRINDSRGHDVGDLVLRGVAERLTRNLRAADTVARIGGDEFVVLLESLRAGQTRPRSPIRSARPWVCRSRCRAATRRSPSALASASTPTMAAMPRSCSRPPMWRCTAPSDDAPLRRRPDPAGVQVQDPGRRSARFARGR
jgi:GGDEF domain-containing protein